jgi:hypothetical protein
MFLKVTAPEVHDKKALDDGVWIVIRGRIRKTIGSEMFKVLTENAFNEGGPAELGNDWRFEKVRDHI